MSIHNQSWYFGIPNNRSMQHRHTHTLTHTHTHTERHTHTHTHTHRFRLGYVPLLGLGLHPSATQFSPPPHPVGLGLPPFTVLFIIIPRLSHTIDVESIMEPPDPHQLVTTFGRLSPSQSRNVCPFPRTPVRQVAVTSMCCVGTCGPSKESITG